MPSTGRLPLDRLRLIRRWLGLSQRELADRLGCSQPAVAQVETGAARPSARFKARMVRLLAPRLASILFEPDPTDTTTQGGKP